MSLISRPLWQLLLLLEGRNPKQTLSCNEWFAVFEYLAEAIVTPGNKRDLLMKKAREHLAACPECKDYFFQRLADMEAQYREQLG